MVHLVIMHLLILQAVEVEQEQLEEMYLVLHQLLEVLEEQELQVI
jgi:hypothetical protein